MSDPREPNYYLPLDINTVQLYAEGTYPGDWELRWLASRIDEDSPEFEQVAAEIARDLCKLQEKHPEFQ